MLRFKPAAFARLIAFLFDLPCCSLTRRLAFSRARFSSFALYVEEILAIVCPCYFVNGMPNSFSRARPSSSVRALVTIEMFMPRVLSTLLKSISGKINWSLIPIV